MRPSRTRYITACQQLLALGVVLVALAPAASVVSLDVVGVEPDPTLPALVPGDPAGEPGVRQPARERDLSAYAKETVRRSVVPTEVVEPVVREVPLAAPRPGTPRERRGSGRTEIVSEPQSVSGYGTVGVTWDGDEQVPEEDISLQVRTLDNGTWSGWTDMAYHDDHGPDPGSVEAARARVGTDEALVGEVDQVQVRLEVDGEVPDDLRLAVVEPGDPATSEAQAPAIDTSELGDESEPRPADETATESAESAESDGAIALQSTVFTPKPQIYSRAQWGANEKMRDKPSLHYGEVHGGFVHHTVNANAYSRKEVPAILRSIYAYHVKSRGWSDIGYNFLVDRFGRVWEGRYGGVDRAVAGAHTKHYNEYSFAMSAIGNFETAQPTAAILQAYGAVFAWKLSLHGVSASSPAQKIGSKAFPAINGHRDAAATACPGKYLYAQIPQIRGLAAAAQQSWSGRELASNLAGSPYPDLIVRRAKDGQGVILPTGGLLQAGTPTTVSPGWGGVSTVVASPDLTGDGTVDLLAIGAQAAVHPGAGDGTFGSPILSSDELLGHDLVTPAGDLDGDQRNDVLARAAGTGSLDAFLGTGSGGFTRVRLAGDWSGYNLLAATGDLTKDGKADVVGRDSTGALWIHPGNGSGSFGTRIAVTGKWDKYDVITGFGDYTQDGRADLFVRKRSNGLGYVIPSRGSGKFAVKRGPMVGVTGVSGLTGGGTVAGSPAPDLLARSGDNLVLFTNPGTVDLERPILTGMDLSSANRVLNAGDWDRDGFGDVVTRHRNGTLHLRRGNGSGQFAGPVPIGTGFDKVKLLAAVGDMTGDGYPDLVGQPSGKHPMRIYPGAGTAGLKRSYPAAGRVKADHQVGVGRWDADGAPDTLVQRGNALTMYAGNGPGGFTGSRSLPINLAKYNWVLGIGDVGIVGHPDLVVRERKTGYLWLIQGSSTGFSAPRFLGGGKSYDLAG